MDDQSEQQYWQHERFKHALRCRSIWLVICTVLFVVAWILFPQLGFVFPDLFNAIPAALGLSLYIFAIPIFCIAVVLVEVAAFLIYRKAAFNAVSMLIEVVLFGLWVAWICLVLRGLGQGPGL